MGLRDPCDIGEAAWILLIWIARCWINL